MGDIFHHAGKILFDVGYKRRTAGACKESLFGKLSCLGKKHHICAESRFYNGVETELFKSRNDLTEFRIGELAGNRGSNHCVKFVLGVVFALFDEVDYVKDIRLVRNRAPRTLIYACAALYALGIVDFRRAVFVHGDSLDLASHFAGTLMVGDCAVRTNFRACAALFAL